MGWNLLYTLGNSDIQVKGGGRIDKQDFRAWTEQIYRSVDDGVYSVERVGRYTFKIGEKEVTFPLFIPFLEHAIRSEEESELKRIYLFATDQGDSEVAKQDTIYLALLLRDFIIPSIIKNYPKERVVIERIDKNPARHEELSEFFIDFISREGRALESVSVNYFQVTAGTPALGICLLTALEEYPFRAFALIKKYGEEGCEIVEARFLRRLVVRKYVDSIERLVKSYSYADAIGALKSSPLRSGGLILEKLLEVMRLRRIFNFKKAKEEVEMLPDSFDGRKKLLDYFSDVLESVGGRLRASFEEFEIYLKKGEYHSACAALFNFIDVLYTAAFEEQTGIKLEKKDGEFKDFQKFLEEKNISLDKYIPSFPNICKVMKILKDRGELKDLPEVKCFEKLFLDGSEIKSIIDKLREVRNRGPFAHGVGGFPLDLEDDLKWVYNELKKFLNLPENFYDIANDLILRTLETLI